jgi:hypothetical protein
MQVKSTIKLNMPRINQMTQAAVVALEKTAEALHTEVVQAQIMHYPAHPMQGGCIIIRNIISRSMKILLRVVNGLIRGFREESALIFARKPLKSFIRRQVAYDAAIN